MKMSQEEMKALLTRSEEVETKRIELISANKAAANTILEAIKKQYGTELSIVVKVSTGVSA